MGLNCSLTGAYSFLSHLCDRLHLTSLLLCVVLPVSLAQAEPTGSTPFEQAIHAAIDTNPKILAARSTLAATRERYEQSLASLLPDVVFNASRSHRSDTWTDTGSNQSPSRFNIRLAQPVFRWPLFLALEQTKPLISAAEEDYNATLQSVLLETIQAMVSVLLTENVARLAEKNLVLTQRNLDAAISRRRAGDLTRTDVDQATARVASSESELIHAKNDAMVARARFEEVAGISVPEGLTIPDAPPYLLKGTLQELTSQRQYRPDLKAAALRLSAADVAIEMEKAGHLPMVDLQADAITYRGGTGGANSISGENEYSVAVQLSVPLYSGGKTLSKIRESIEMRAGRQSEQQRIDNQALREINQAHLAMRSANASVASSEAAFQFYHQAVKGMEEEFAAGFRTVIDLLELQNQSFRAEMELIKNRHEWVSAQYQLLYTLGHLTPGDLRFPGSKPVEISQDVANRTEEANLFTRFIDTLRKPATSDLTPTPSQSDETAQARKKSRERSVHTQLTPWGLKWAQRLQGKRGRGTAKTVGKQVEPIHLPGRTLPLSLSNTIRAW